MPLHHLALVLAVCLAWGGNFLASAYALQHVPPLLFTALRLTVVLMCLLPFLRPIERSQRILVGAIALLNGSLHFGLNFGALTIAGDISSVAIALQCYIPMSAILGVVLLRERVEPGTVVGIVLAFAGVMVLGFDPLVLDAPLALFLSLTAALLLALGTTLMRKVRGVNALEMQAWSAVLGIPVLLVLSSILEEGQREAIASAGWLDWGGVLYSALLGSILGHGALFWLVQRHPVSVVTPYLLVTPVVAVLLGVLVWGDRPGPKLLLGALLVLSGVLIVTLRGLSRPTTPLADSR